MNIELGNSFRNLLLQQLCNTNTLDKQTYNQLNIELDVKLRMYLWIPLWDQAWNRLSRVTKDESN
jgi:hypothetical protein